MWIKPLPYGFGAEVIGLRQACRLPSDDIDELRQCYDHRDLLVFRDLGALSPERQVEIAGWFRPVIGEPAAWTTLDNADPAGRQVLPFHSDITFLEFPLSGISLYPQELPFEATSTTFVSNTVAWDHLPSSIQNEVRGLTARHYFASNDQIDLGRPFFEYWHPLLMKHGQTGRPLLFATEHHVDRIEGMDELQSMKLLQRLFEILYAPARRYEHIWCEGDLLIWNNMAIQHARTREAGISRGRRVMRRVQLGTVSFTEQVERLRMRASASDRSG